eukprot:CAMPEP_0169117254 /NCGR_PEP_ID=MMETSP1015-20121227/30358_1 /TAXON_ID=342587 /ORGANISM="Karlodinium micrum, Strain CCMP2283" /LENGTH=175 /DNA_ID=CAMNT_0009179921 /DNA_START=390 /DNA_END=917 /DNA_ORIENTATION=+
MKLTWTPFKHLDGVGYNKLPFELCWDHWRKISDALYKYREDFARFGTTSAREMPEMTPVEVLAVSYMLGGGVWTKKKGEEVAASLGFDKSLPLSFRNFPMNKTVLTEEDMTSAHTKFFPPPPLDDADDELDLPPLPIPVLKRSKPRYHISENCGEDGPEALDLDPLEHLGDEFSS